MFNKIVETYLNIQKGNPKNEFEIRFGSFTQSKYFDCNVDISFFYRLKKMLKIQNNGKNHINNIYTDTYYKHNNEIYRETFDQNKDIKYLITKRSIKYHNDFDYDIRFSVASESNIKTPIQLNNKILIREKDRDSFFFNCGKIDLTKVNEINLETNVTKLKFEIEFEIGNFTSKKITSSDSGSDPDLVRPCTQQDLLLQKVNEICNIITYILQIKHDNFYIISNNEYNLIVNQYKTLTKSSFFIGAQPETLQKDNLNLFYNELYSVTQKVDGDRCFLFINASNDMYFVDTNLKIIKTLGKNTDYTNTIIDGELLRTENKIHFMAFDLLIYNTIDLRGNQEYNLIKRIEILKNIISKITFTTDLYKVSCKKYIFKNVFLGCELLLNPNVKLRSDNDGLLHKNSDGLIFTPINEPYSATKKWIKLLKWKPKELNTIDFLSIKKEPVEGGNGRCRWELYIQTVNEQKKMESELFNVNLLSDKFEFNFIEKTNLTTFQTDFDDSFIDPTTLEHFKSNTVIEYKWDYTLKKFIPLKTRWDKTLNPFKQGNFGSVACSIWNNITNPIEKDILFKLKNLNNKDDIYFKNMRRFHNKIKEGLYNKHIKNSDSLLELCVGKGGDLHKWLYNNVKYVCGYDISEKNLNECNERYKNCNNNSLHANFYKLDLRHDNSAFIIQNHLTSNNKVANGITHYSSVCCHFAIHYFFESKTTFDNLINILDTCMSENATFMVTYMDAKNVNKLFQQCDDKQGSRLCSGLDKPGSQIVYKEDNGNIVYFLKKTVTKNNSAFGNKLKIFLDGNNILNETSDEFLVDSTFLIDYLQSKGYTCIESDYFKNNHQYKNYNLNEYEKTISSLNMYSIFKKNKDQTTKSTLIKSDTKSQDTQNIQFTLNKPVSVFKNESLSEIQSLSSKSKIIEFDNLSLITIENTFDIYDLLNCNTYSINKNYYKNSPIVSLQDIRNAIDIINTSSTNINICHLNTLDPDFVRACTQQDRACTQQDRACTQHDTVSLSCTRPEQSLEPEFEQSQKSNGKHSNYLYIYHYDYITTTQTETQGPVSLSCTDYKPHDSPVLIEKKNTNWYIVLSKYKMFYDFDKNLFSKLDIYKTKTESNETVVNTQEKELIDTLQLLSISPKKPSVCNTLDTLDNQDTFKKLKSDVHSEYENILNNKPTIKILKSFIEKMNKIHLKNVKISGTKDVLIERIKKEFNLN